VLSQHTSIFWFSEEFGDGVLMIKISDCPDSDVVSVRINLH
jgi:hypothetical protein